MRAIAINVGANTNEPGFRGPVNPDGSFEYIPIPEAKSTHCPVPTYADLAPELQTPIPESLRDTPVHLDPEFAEYPCCENYTYGDDHGVKAGPLSELSAGDLVIFYATLSVTGAAEWLPPEWGAFCIGQFRLDKDPITPVSDDSTSEAGDTEWQEHDRFATNAHCKREPMDARVLLSGDPDESGLFSQAMPLSTPAGGTHANEIVTELSADSGKGPWWRRPLRFDAESTSTLRELLDASPAVFVDYQQ